MRHRLILLCLLLVVVCSACTSAPPTTANRTSSAVPSGFIGHQGRWLTDSQNRIFLPHGINYVVKQPPFDPLNGFSSADASFLAAGGFRAVRLGVIFGALMPKPGKINATYLHQIVQMVNLLSHDHIFVLLDMHQDEYGPVTGVDGFPAWATITHGAANPKLAFPNGYYKSPAVQAAWASFWVVFSELGCDWHTVNDTIIAYGTALVDDDPDRFGEVEALGLDEVLMVRLGTFHRQEFSTQIVDVGRGQLLDVVPGRSSAGPMAWLAEQGKPWCDEVRFATLDLSGPYRRVFTLMLPDATQVADPFHLVKLANTKLDECRRRVQNDTVGHRGRKSDPLYRCRRLLTKAEERLDVLLGGPAGTWWCWPPGALHCRPRYFGENVQDEPVDPWLRHHERTMAGCRLCELRD